MDMRHPVDGFYSRRDFLARGLYGVGIGAALPAFLSRTSAALTAEALQGTSVEKHPERILVVLELSGGNDGLNTVVPFGDPAYYRARPHLGIPDHTVLKVGDGVGFHPSMVGFERLYKDGSLAVVHGCGYDQPSLWHSSSMNCWHTGVPNSGESLGWLGRLADDTYDPAIDHVIADMGTSPSLAVRSGRHAPLVCDDPARLTRTTTDPALGFLRAPATNAVGSSDFVRQASATYRTPVDYGLGNAFGSDLRRVAASIAAKMPTRLYYVSYPGNAFDTHIQQADVHNRLLTYTADAVRAFMEDIARIGRADDVAVMMFTEFGRRVEENSSRGTDHGTATPMFIVGKHVKGGFYGRPPSLTDLDGGNLKMTTDFRSVYATMIDGWLGSHDTQAVLKGRFEPLNVFG
jgi:uncharacterized protein (DUF1501 family)